MRFDFRQEAHQYCDGIMDWDYSGSENINDGEQIADCCYENDCCIACAIEKLGDNPADYAIECECDND